ncbi:MAG: hypothetical protein LBS56_06715 [Propionibacteriaceae bacterium]|jgi:hypothetical protein|nr:hypothetical protein [Propionibacteriaceae bacterium]
MTIATVVIAPQSVVDTAALWARRGLVADSLWVSSDGFPGVDPDAPNAIPVRVLRFDHEPLDDTLALQLAGLEALDEARVVWVRLSDDSNEKALRELATQLRELLPHDTTHWIDVVVPRKRTDETFAPLAGEWVQFRIHPSDRPAPDVTDAGWDLALAVPLHVTLALAGILGGTVTDLPWARLNAGQYHIVRVFSRLVDGGLEARRTSREFLHTALPATHAAEQHGDKYLPADPRRASEIVDQAAAWLLAHEDGALGYQAPAPSRLEGHPRLTLREHMAHFVRFVPTATMTLLGRRPEPDAPPGHVLEFDDLGYSIGPKTPVVRWTGGVPDFDALEARAAAEAAQAVARVRAKEGAQPPTGAWEPLARLSTILVDGGGAAPLGWDMDNLTSHQRQLSLPPDCVVLGPAEPVEAPAPELGHASNNTVVARALREVSRSWGEPIRAQTQATRVAATAARLASQANTDDARRLRAQLAGLGTGAAPARPASLLEQVHGAVLGGLIRSRLDAERWEDLAVHKPPGKAPSWDGVGSRFRWTFWVLVFVLVALAVAWRIWRDDVNSALGADLSFELGLVVLGVALVVLVVLVLYLVFRSWAAFMERGRRRLELMALWLDRAVKARSAHGALENTERAARLWVDLLSRVPERRDPDESEVFDSEAELSPMSLRIGHPRFRRHQMARWLADAGAKPGWRLACLRDVVGRFSGVPAERAIAWLAEDRGLPGGRLDHLGQELDEHQAAWRDDARPAIAVEVMAKMTENADSIEVVRNPKLPLQQTCVKSFLAELTPPDDDLDDWPDDADHSWVVAAGPGADPDKTELVVSAALCTGRIRVQITDSDHVDEADDDPEPDGPTSPFR